MYLIITIDTEGDNAWDRKGYENSTKNARFLPRFQNLCDKFGYKPTYLTSYEMAKDEFFIEFAADTLKRGVCEVGLHPHPWNSPPEYKLTCDDMALHPYLIEYPENIIREKIKIHTELLEARLGTKMYSHRAGRWLFNATYARILCDFGYKVDCSITPLVNWTEAARQGPDRIKIDVPDYSAFPSKPYFLNSEDISEAGSLPILELPMTIIPNYGKFLLLIYRALPKGLSQRIVRGVFGQPVSWFRPNKRNASDMIRVAKAKLENETKDNAEYIMFMLHSSEFMPGGSPQFETESQIEKLYDNITKTFEFLYNQGVTGATCFAFYNIYKGKRS